MRHIEQLEQTLPLPQEYFGDAFEFTPVVWDESLSLPQGTVLRFFDRDGEPSLVFECIAPSMAFSGPKHALGRLHEMKRGVLESYDAEVSLAHSNPLLARLHEPYAEISYADETTSTRITPLKKHIESVFVPQLAEWAHESVWYKELHKRIEGDTLQQASEEIVVFLSEIALRTRDRGESHDIASAAAIVEQHILGVQAAPEESIIEKNLDAFIDRWGADIRDAWTNAGKFDDDTLGMHRTALIAICSVREAQAARKAQH